MHDLKNYMTKTWKEYNENDTKHNAELKSEINGLVDLTSSFSNLLPRDKMKTALFSNSVGP